MFKWIKESNGFYSSKNTAGGTTEEFSKFSELQRTRWSLWEFLKLLIKRYLESKRKEKKLKTTKYDYFVSDPDIENFDSEPE